MRWWPWQTKQVETQTADVSLPDLPLMWFDEAARCYKFTFGDGRVHRLETENGF